MVNHRLRFTARHEVEASTTVMGHWSLAALGVCAAASSLRPRGNFLCLPRPSIGSHSAELPWPQSGFVQRRSDKRRLARAALPVTPTQFTFFFLTSLLEYNCFTMVCPFLLYNKVNQLYIYIYPHISSLLCLPPTLPIPPL